MNSLGTSASDTSCDINENILINYSDYSWTAVIDSESHLEKEIGIMEHSRAYEELYLFYTVFWKAWRRLMSVVNQELILFGLEARLQFMGAIIVLNGNAKGEWTIIMIIAIYSSKSKTKSFSMSVFFAFFDTNKYLILICFPCSFMHAFLIPSFVQLNQCKNRYNLLQHLNTAGPGYTICICLMAVIALLLFSSLGQLSRIIYLIWNYVQHSQWLTCGIQKDQIHQTCQMKNSTIADADETSLAKQNNCYYK